MKDKDNTTDPGRIAIIIGATSGIGKSLVPQLIDSGYNIGITGRRAELLNNIQAKYPGKVLSRCFDVSDVKTALANLEKLVEEIGGLDLLIISAGTGDLNYNLDFTTEKLTIDTNVSGFTHLAGWVYNYFKHKNSGHLVVITSVAGLRGNRHAPAYNASKAYQVNYLEGLRQKAHHEKLNISITDIRPGFVDTAMAKGDGKFWVATPDVAAKQIMKAIRKKQKVAYVTKRWKLVALLVKMLPRWIMDKF